MKTYNVKEAADVLAVSVKAIQRRCKRDDIRKKSNMYLITQDDVDRWENETTLQRQSDDNSDIVASLRKEIKELKKFKENVLRNQKAANIDDDLFHENIEKEFNINKNQQNKL